MNKKIKVIELLNRIHENKNVPKRVKFEGIEYIYVEDEQDYKYSINDYLFIYIVRYSPDWLNVEVEILEDEKEIDIQGINENDYEIEYWTKDIFTTDILNDLFKKIVFEVMRNRNKQNEILKAVKQLDKKINKEEK